MILYVQDWRMHKAWRFEGWSASILHVLNIYHIGRHQHLTLWWSNETTLGVYWKLHPPSITWIGEACTYGTSFCWTFLGFKLETGEVDADRSSRLLHHKDRALCIMNTIIAYATQKRPVTIVALISIRETVLRTGPKRETRKKFN